MQVRFLERQFHVRQQVSDLVYQSAYGVKLYRLAEICRGHMHIYLCAGDQPVAEQVFEDLNVHAGFDRHNSSKQESPPNSQELPLNFKGNWAIGVCG
jgi:hypothetical protein